MHTDTNIIACRCARTVLDRSSRGEHSLCANTLAAILVEEARAAAYRDKENMVGLCLEVYLSVGDGELVPARRTLHPSESAFTRYFRS